jgi:predicted RNA-binding protein with PUA-like domain
MNYWLLKSEPFKYPWDQLEKDKVTFWDGVRNYAARNNLKAMKKGDKAFFYHSNEGVEIVGIVKIVKEFYQDPTTDDPNWVVVDVSPVKKLKTPITLSQIKNTPALQNMALVKQSRLSVQPVTQDEWELICDMAGVQP